MKKKFLEQDRLFDNELEEEELRLVDIHQMRTAKSAMAQHK